MTIPPHEARPRTIRLRASLLVQCSLSLARLLVFVRCCRCPAAVVARAGRSARGSHHHHRQPPPTTTNDNTYSSPPRLSVFCCRPPPPSRRDDDDDDPPQQLQYELKSSAYYVIYRSCGIYIYVIYGAPPPAHQPPSTIICGLLLPPASCRAPAPTVAGGRTSKSIDRVGTA